MPKVSLGATIPVAQYGNLQPVIEAEGDTVEGALEIALGHIQKLWDRTSAKPLEINRDTPAETPVKILRCQVSGTQVAFDPVAHVYRGADGKQWLGGSTFAGRYKQPFPGEIIAAKMAEKYKVDADQILAMWALNAEASSTFGIAVHAALQLRGEYAELSRRVKNDTLDSALTTNPVLRPIVESFFEGREDERAFYEAFVADPKRRHCGLIDRLVVDDDGLWVEDYKTNASVHKDETILEPFKGVVPNTALGAYWLQLSFYSNILMSHGRVVKGLRIHHWNDSGWETHEHPVVDLSPANESGQQ